MLLNVTQSLLLYTEVLTKRFLVQGQRWYMYSLRVLSVRRVLILKHGASVSHARPNKSKACAVCTAPLLWVQMVWAYGRSCGIALPLFCLCVVVICGLIVRRSSRSFQSISVLECMGLKATMRHFTAMFLPPCCGLLIRGIHQCFRHFSASTSARFRAMVHGSFEVQLCADVLTFA